MAQIMHALGWTHSTAGRQHHHTSAPVSSLRVFCGSWSVSTDARLIVYYRQSGYPLCCLQLLPVLCVYCGLLCTMSTAAQAKCEEHIRHTDEESEFFLGGLTILEK